MFISYQNSTVVTYSHNFKCILNGWLVNSHRRSYPSHNINATKMKTVARKIALPPIQDHHLPSSSSSSAAFHLRFLRFLPCTNNCSVSPSPWRGQRIARERRFRDTSYTMYSAFLPSKHKANMLTPHLHITNVTHNFPTCFALSSSSFLASSSCLCFSFNSASILRHSLSQGKVVVATS